MRSTIEPAWADEPIASAIAMLRLHARAVLRDARVAVSLGGGLCPRPLTSSLIQRSDAKHRVSKDAPVRAGRKRTNSIVRGQCCGQGIEPLRNHVLDILAHVLRRDPDRRAPLAAIMRKRINVSLGNRRIGARQRRQRSGDPRLVEAGKKVSSRGRVLVARPQILLLKAGRPKGVELWGIARCKRLLFI